MKSIFWFPLAVVLMSDASAAQPAPNALAQVKALAQQGNHREAAEIGKEALLSPQADAELLKETLGALSNLNAMAEQETVIEATVKAHPQRWDILSTAGAAYAQLDAGGTVIDGVFQRGNYQNQGQVKEVALRDRVRQLQLLWAAWKAVPEATPVVDKAGVLESLMQALQDGHHPQSGAWALLALTDLEVLPGYDDESGLDEPIQGYPVDAEGAPIFFKNPISWEAARNDGERLLWAMNKRAGLSAELAVQARMEMAELAQNWFSVQTLAEYGFQRIEATNESQTRAGIASLHTLKDEETVAKLATGPKRFTLPEEWNFMQLFRDIAEDPKATLPQRKSAWANIAGELGNRRQHDRQVETLKRQLELLPEKIRLKVQDKKRPDSQRILPKTTDEDQLEDEAWSIQESIDMIVGNWGRLEPRPAQSAGASSTSLSLLYRNAKTISLTARKVDVAKLLADTEAYLRSSPQQTDWPRMNADALGQKLQAPDHEKYIGDVVAEWTQKLEPHSMPHWDKRVEVSIPLKEAGAYLIEGTFEGGNKTRALMWVESLVIVKTALLGEQQYFIADAVTGAPVPGAKVRFFGYHMEWKEGSIVGKPRYDFQFKDAQLTSDEKGVVKLSGKDLERYQWLAQASTADGRLAFLGFQHLNFSAGREIPEEQTRLYGLTDRPVYRPGQEVKWKAWARKVGYDPKLDTNAFAGAKIEVTISNPKGEEVLKRSYEADESGAINDTLALEEEATLGDYNISFTQVRALRPNQHLGSHHFKVEEYKKPEFEVKVEAPTVPVALGDAFEVKVKADYFFGGPVKQGKVKYKVQRHEATQRWFPQGRWDWLFGAGYGWRASHYAWYPGAQNWCVMVPSYPWFRFHSDPPELVAEGESPLNADGTFTVKVDTALAKELHGNKNQRYEVDVEVTDASRRTIFGKGSVLVAQRPFDVYVSADRGFYQAGESGNIHVNARTLEGRSVKATGELVLYRVTYAADGTPSEEAVHTEKLTLGTEENQTATVRLTFVKGGQYRVSAKLKDAAGKEEEGVSFLTVRGAGFEEGKDFRFDDLELITQNDEYAPGDEVELTINTNRTGSTVALFLRPQNGIYPAPVWLKLVGKSTTHRFKLSETDQPNFFIEAYTVSTARVHQVTRQIIVPPQKRIATVELLPDAETYLPGQGSKVKVRVKDQNGHPFTGKVVLTAYDKALEYISGGSNQEDIRPFFWGWKRSHYPQLEHSLRAVESDLLKEGERRMEDLGQFNGMADAFSVNISHGRPPGGGRGMARAMMAAAAAPVAALEMAPGGGAPPPPPTAMKMAPEADAAESGPQPMIRTNLADSAVWVADFTTDAEGLGELNFTLPENLTTWKLSAWVMGPQTQVGEASVEVITRKNLMVRLQTPRFFVEKDEVVLSANVHNELDVAQEVKAVLEFPGSEALLAFVDPEQKSPRLATLPPHSEHRFDWRVKVTGEGQAKIRVKALAAKDSDAMEMTFPAYTHGLLKTDSWSLALRPDQASGQIAFTIPAERKPGQSRLELRYSPTLAMALVDALPYLTDYPYGCTEQTLNRFLPTVITLDVLRDLGVNLKDIRDKRTNLNAQEIGDAAKRAQRWQETHKTKTAVFDEDEVRKMASAGLKKLEAMRNSDGGWSWFPGGRESSPHITALVVHGLHVAQQRDLPGLGEARTPAFLAQAVQFLKQHEAEQLRRLRLTPKDKQVKDSPDQLDALIHATLVEHKAGDKAMRDQLYEKRAGLSPYNLALLGLACDASKEQARRDMCLRNLRQFLKEDAENQTAWLDLPGGRGWFWWDDVIETQAVFLRLLVTAEPKGSTAAGLAKYLLNNRRHGTYWNSTKDTAAVIEALAAFVKASGESNPQVTLEILLDGQPLKKVEITRENLFTFDNSVVIEDPALTTGQHTLQVRKLGSAPLYASAYLTVFSQEDSIPAAGLEVKAHRKFYQLIEEKPEQQVAGSRGQVLTQTGLRYRRQEIPTGTPIRSGDLIEVELTIESKNDYEYVLIQDPKPAGFEPVAVQSGWSYEGLATYQEYRDEKVAFFADRLPKGTHNLRYRVKAEIPGKFSALPTQIEAMYAPELRGNSDEWKAHIQD